MRTPCQGFKQIIQFFAISTVHEKAGRDELQEEIERGHFVRAEHLAKSLGLPEKEIQDLRLKALWEMAAVNRNAPGTKRLAQEYGLSKEELKELLEKYTEEKRNEGVIKPLEPCYDISTGEYLSFEEWMNHFLKKWDKLSAS